MTARVCTGVLHAQSDQRLVAMAACGHELAFEVLVRRYHRPLLAYARRLPAPGTSPEDTLQHAFMHAWQALQGGTEVCDVRAWLYRIVRNSATRLQAKAGAEHIPLPDTMACSARLDEQAEQRSAARAALAGVAALPPRQREVMVLSAVDGRRHDEVAAVLGVTRGAVRGLLHRARLTLRNAAGALIPYPLARWSTDPHRSGLWPERITQAGAGAGAGGLGLGGLLAKGGAIAVTAGVVAFGAGSHAPRVHDLDPSSRGGGAARLVASRVAVRGPAVAASSDRAERPARSPESGWRATRVPSRNGRPGRGASRLGVTGTPASSSAPAGPAGGAAPSSTPTASPATGGAEAVDGTESPGTTTTVSPSSTTASTAAVPSSDGEDPAATPPGTTSSATTSADTTTTTADGSTTDGAAASSADGAAASSADGAGATTTTSD